MIKMHNNIFIWLSGVSGGAAMLGIMMLQHLPLTNVANSSLSCIGFLLSMFICMFIYHIFQLNDKEDKK